MLYNEQQNIYLKGYLYSVSELVFFYDHFLQLAKVSIQFYSIQLQCWTVKITLKYENILGYKWINFLLWFTSTWNLKSQTLKNRIQKSKDK